MNKNIVLALNNRIRRWVNSYHLYDFPSQQGGWEKQNGPVLGDRETGSIFDPFVCKEADYFRMFVSNRRNRNIEVYESEDALSWTKVGVALDPTQGSTWEESVNRAAVVRSGNLWYMWYTGQTMGGSRIGVARSFDGVHFERFVEQPVISPEDPYEKNSVMNPFVLWDEEEGIFKMWYASGETYEPDVLCYATSRNGVDWMKDRNNPIFAASGLSYDKDKVGGCEVIKVSSKKYIMFYIGYQNVDNARICMAVSENGITNWNRSPDNPILSPSRNSWDRHALYKPAVYYSQSKRLLYLWYNGRRNMEEYIGLALKSETYDLFSM